MPISASMVTKTGYLRGVKHPRMSCQRLSENCKLKCKQKVSGDWAVVNALRIWAVLTLRRGVVPSEQTVWKDLNQSIIIPPSDDFDEILDWAHGIHDYALVRDSKGRPGIPDQTAMSAFAQISSKHFVIKLVWLAKDKTAIYQVCVFQPTFSRLVFESVWDSNQNAPLWLGDVMKITPPPPTAVVRPVLSCPGSRSSRTKDVKFVWTRGYEKAERILWSDLTSRSVRSSTGVAVLRAKQQNTQPR